MVDTLSAPVEASEPYLQRHYATMISYRQFATRVKLDYTSGGQAISFTAVVRLYVDSLVWLSLQGPFSIEGVRILVTKDSINMINKLSGEYLSQSISYLQQLLPIATDINTLQYFILGYHLPTAAAKPVYRGLEDSLCVIQSQSPAYRYTSWLAPQNYTMTKSLLIDQRQSRQMNLTFEHYILEQNRPFSSERSITIRQGNRVLGLSLSYGRVKIDEPLAFPFEIQPGMKRVEEIKF